MSFGTFYKIGDEIRSAFEGKTSKGQWYDALGEIEIENYESCDAEESLPSWVLALKDAKQPLNQLFEGELRAEPDGYDDPDVVFIGIEMVASIVKDIDDKSKPYFEKLLCDVNCAPDIWLFDSMFKFLKNAAANNEAILILWGG